MNGLQGEVAAIDQASAQWALALLFDLTRELQTSEQLARSVDIIKHNLADHDDGAGLSPRSGVLYKYFESKDTLLAAGLERHLATIGAIEVELALLPLGEMRSEFTMLGLSVPNTRPRRSPGITRGPVRRRLASAHRAESGT